MNEDYEINLGEFLDSVIKRKYIVITVVILSAAISAIFSYFVIQPVYESEVTVIADKKGDSSGQTVQYNDVMMYQNLIKTYANIGKSDAVYTEAVKQLNDSISADKLKSSISITPITDTQLLTISAKGKNPEEALGIVTAVSESFIKVANKVFPAGDVRIVDKGRLPEAPKSPQKRLNIVLGLLIGIIISLTIVVLLNYFDSTIESEEDIKKYFQLPVLGVIQLEKD